MISDSRIILDLCGGSGSWTLPYAEAGYDVRNITLPGCDVLSYSPPDSVHGILAAPPCDHFSGSGARWWKEKDQDGRTITGMGVVIACLKIIATTQPVFWALENPVGRLRKWLNDPKLIFNPCDFGDTYTKKTLLWGNFNLPTRTPVEPIQGSKMHLQYGGKTARTKRLRSITPPGFARAFFEANR